MIRTYSCSTSRSCDWIILSSDSGTVSNYITILTCQLEYIVVTKIQIRCCCISCASVHGYGSLPCRAGTGFWHGRDGRSVICCFDSRIYILRGINCKPIRAVIGTVSSAIFLHFFIYLQTAASVLVYKFLYVISTRVDQGYNIIEMINSSFTYHYILGKYGLCYLIVRKWFSNVVILTEYKIIDSDPGRQTVTPGDSLSINAFSSCIRTGDSHDQPVLQCGKVSLGHTHERLFDNDLTHWLVSDSEFTVFISNCRIYCVTVRSDMVRLRMAGSLNNVVVIRITIRVCHIQPGEKVLPVFSRIRAIRSQRSRLYFKTRILDITGRFIRHNSRPRTGIIAVTGIIGAIIFIAVTTRPKRCGSRILTRWRH